MSRKSFGELAAYGVGGTFVAILFFVVLGLLFVASSLMSGWVGTHLWAWFAVPYGAPRIGLWGFVGIATLLTFLLRGLEPAERKVTASGIFVQIVLSPLLTLLFGYLIHLAQLKWG